MNETQLRQVFRQVQKAVNAMNMASGLCGGDLDLTCVYFPRLAKIRKELEVIEQQLEISIEREKRTERI